jgi:hypothetical protein
MLIKTARKPGNSAYFMKPAEEPWDDFPQRSAFGMRSANVLRDNRMLPIVAACLRDADSQALAILPRMRQATKSRKLPDSECSAPASKESCQVDAPATKFCRRPSRYMLGHRGDTGLMLDDRGRRSTGSAQLSRGADQRVVTHGQVTPLLKNSNRGKRKMVHSNRLPENEPSLESSQFWWQETVGGRLSNLTLKAPVEDIQATRDFSCEMHRLPEQRRQLIFRIRRQIAEGTYDTERKLDVALDRMFDAIVDESHPGR